MKIGAIAVVRIERRTRGQGIDVGVGWSSLELRDLRENVVGDADDVQVDLEATENAVSKRPGRVAFCPTRPPVKLGRPSYAGRASSRVLGEHRGRNRDIGTTVEQIIDRPSKSRRPLYRNGHVTDGRAPAPRRDSVDNLAAIRYGADALERVERREIPDKELIRHAELARQRLHEVIVEMETTGEDQSDELVQSGTAGVRVESDTRPK